MKDRQGTFPVRAEATTADAPGIGEDGRPAGDDESSPWRVLPVARRTMIFETFSATRTTPQDIMKRPQKPFVIEHKRRTRPATDAPPSIWSGSVGREMRSLVEAGDLAEAEAPEAAPRKAPAAPALAVRARILEARAEPVPAAVAEPEPPAAPPRPRGRPRKIRPDVPAETSPRDWSREAWEQGVEEEERSAPAEPSLAAAAPLPADIEDAPTADASPKRPKLTLRERRLEARKKLPVGQRWKWPLKV